MLVPIRCFTCNKVVRYKEYQKLSEGCDDKQAVALGQSLEQQGLLVGVIRPPTVPAGTARLRITLSANHSEQQVNQLLSALEVAHVH